MSDPNANSKHLGIVERLVIKPKGTILNGKALFLLIRLVLLTDSD